MNQFSILFLTLVSCILAVAAQNSKCQRGGEYCLNHWDCCSNTCLSFLYKCSHITSTDIRPLESQSRPVITSNDVPLAPESQTVSYESLLEIIFNPLKVQPVAVGRELNSITPRLLEESDGGKFKKEEEIIITTTDGPECLEIGAKCYSNEECCTKRCHGYLHQCVT